MTPAERSSALSSVERPKLEAFARALLSILTGLQRDAERIYEKSHAEMEHAIGRKLEWLAGYSAKAKMQADWLAQAILEAEIHLTNK